MQVENGVHDIPNDVYHSSSGISRSGVMRFKQSPWHYWHRYLNPEKTEAFCSPAMKLGELVHALVLEPEQFKERYAVKPELLDVPKVGLLKDLGREEYDIQKDIQQSVKDENFRIMETFDLNTEGKELISFDMFHEARLYADAVLKDNIAQSLFTDVSVEKSIYFTHKPTGLQCKVRPDAWAGSIVTDLKTCKDASYRAFQSSAYSGGYFIQAAMIKEALESIGQRLEKFIFYCVEKSPCVPCTYYIVDDDSLERGLNEFNTVMYGIAHCLETNKWPSYKPQTLTYPAWARD